MKTRTVIAPLVAAIAALGTSSASAATITIMPLVPSSEHAFNVTSRCAGADRAAAISEAAPAEYPFIPLMGGVGGETLVRVDLDTTGRLRYAGIERSSGNRWLDGAALAAARLTRYSAEVRNCSNVAGSYAIGVLFRPGE